MKVIVLFTVLALAIIAYSEPSYDVECPDDEDPDFVTLIKNPYNCSTYFVCQGGDPIPMTCPKGLHFNDAIKICDWPNSAKCKPIAPPSE
ncbi:hypothetical protein KPH14_001463 [Odynerus spinipes]|uniref:Chitin-binding type-2 domain-containing protein n=1 Tax=Odynerus spinipes TaxID=1348599 RepID=A0AAD9RUT0_9HYME|nr:hypothetical protein KPH14_001463 [Odynerus spinipes]